MKGRIRYTDEPLGEVKPEADFLPSPGDIKLKGKNTAMIVLRLLLKKAKRNSKTSTKSLEKNHGNR